MRKNYLWYELFRHGIVGPALTAFHSRRVVSGLDHVPADKPVLFVPNHQNSFIDALHVVCNTRLFIYFLTRSDPFEKPLLGWFLGTLNMLPVYRVRDGISSVKKNEEIFEKCFEYLAREDAILVFAEANHDLRRRVRPLSKGFTRIAFGAEDQHDWELDVQVVPVGINYGEHRKSLSPVHVRFGECIPVSDYKDVFLENPRKAADLLKKATSEGMKRVTMHVPRLDHYPLHKLLLDDLEPNRADLLDPEIANKRVSVIEDNFDDQLLDEAKQLIRDAEKHNIRLHDFVAPSNAGWKDLLLSPFYLFALINNFLPYLPAKWLIDKAMDDETFDASVKFLSGLVLFPLFYLCVSIIPGVWGIGLPYIVGYALLSVFTAPLFVRAKELLSRSPVQKLRKERPELFESIRARVDKFVSLRESLFSGQM